MNLALIAGLAVIVLTLTAGAPAFVALALGSIILFLFYAQVPGVIIAQQAISAISSFNLIAIPFFIFLGNIVVESGAASALFNLARSFTGHLRAGLGITSIVSCALFGTMCGSGLATTVIMTKVTCPELLKSGYKRERVAAIVGAAGNLGFMIPPSVPAILASEVLGTSTADMFAAILLPGLLTAVLLALTCYLTCRNIKDIKQEPRYGWGLRGRRLVAAAPAFLIPLALFVIIYGGIATPTESSAVSVVVAGAVGILFYKNLRWKQFKAAVSDTVRSSASIYCLIFAAIIFGRVLADMGIPQSVARLVLGAGITPTMFIVLSMIIFLVLGMFLDIVALVYIALPPLVPAVYSLGINPIHYGVFFLALTYIGGLTPPVCISLYAAIAEAKADTLKTFRLATPYMAAVALAILLIGLVPALSTWLPKLIK